MPWQNVLDSDAHLVDLSVVEVKTEPFILVDVAFRCVIHIALGVLGKMISRPANRRDEHLGQIPQPEV